MPKYLQKRRRQWYAILEIPKTLRQQFGRPRFVQSLETESLSVAEKKVLPVIVGWRRQIDIAKGVDVGTDDELLAAVMRVRRDTQRAKVDGRELVELQMAQEEVAIMEALGPNNDYSGDDALFNAVNIAHGKTHLLREHIEEFLASRDVAPKTTDMQRRDLGLFANKFQYAHDATRLKVIDWVNVTLGAEQNLSLGTRSRMISAARMYWDYLEKNKGLTIPSPLHKVLPPKPKKKTKAMIEAQRKAFRVADYHKLLEGCVDDTLKDLITLAAYTGCRIEELCILKLENVSDDKVEIVDAKSEAGWRTIPIHHHIAQTVARLVATSTDGYLLSGLTFNKYGNRSNAIGKSFGRLKKQVGYGESYVFHSFRKGFATQLENANIPVNVSARLMGHEVQGQTFGNYSDGLALKGLRDAINHVDWSLH
ncbi:tyrosine-type recombinase/integrase [Sulfitobacter sp.]|nr:tyrosine-type recombinase/integrase [Sulfitobacter sp.]